jgi:hypothetical protein
MTGSSCQVVYGYLSCGPPKLPITRGGNPSGPMSNQKVQRSRRPCFPSSQGLEYTIYLPIPSATPSPDTIWICNNRASDITPSNDESYWLYLEPPPSPGKVDIDHVFPVGCFDGDKKMIKTPREQDFGTEQNSVLFLVRFSSSQFHFPPLAS